LQNNVDRLAVDNANAKYLAARLASLNGIEVNPDAVITNIVMAKVPNAHQFVETARQRGVELLAVDSQMVRAVCHAGIEREHIDTAVSTLALVLEGAQPEEQVDDGHG
jgi:threonine aldolase